MRDEKERPAAADIRDGAQQFQYNQRPKEGDERGLILPGASKNVHSERLGVPLIHGGRSRARRFRGVPYDRLRELFGIAPGALDVVICEETGRLFFREPGFRDAGEVGQRDAIAAAVHARLEREAGWRR